MSHDDDHRKPRPEEWGVLNALPPQAPTEHELRRRPGRRPTRPHQQPEHSLLPDPAVMVDVPIKSHRSYAGLVFLVLIAGGAVALYFVMQQDLTSERVRGNPNIKVAAPTLQQVGAVDEDIAPPPPPKKAMLRIESDPSGAEVVVNGNRLADPTPTAVQVFANRRAEVHVQADGHRPVHKTVKVGGDAHTTSLRLEEAEVETGSLEIVSDPPGAFVHYRGEVVGEAPVKIEGVPAHTPVFARLQMEGHYPHVVRYEVGPGEDRRLGVKMAPDDGDRTFATVTVEANPLVTTVKRIDGSKTKTEGTTGSRPVIVRARIGYPLVLQGSATKYADERAMIDVKDPYYTVHLRLSPPVVEYGKISLKGPRSLTVYLDGDELDSMPIRNLEVPVGTHELVVVDTKTRTRAKESLTIVKGETTSRVVVQTDEGRIEVQE